ncbi:ZBED5 protein, partial [Atractosteus spatula]|nr:ZBED5 protein [Atractosteus spatula]
VHYALQADESTDIVNFANLLVFFRYEVNEVRDDLLLCQPMPGHTTGLLTIVFKKINWIEFVTLLRGKVLNSLFELREEFFFMKPLTCRTIYMTNVANKIDSDVLQTMKLNLESLQKDLCKYFPKSDNTFEGIRNPFTMSVQTLSNNLSHSEEEQLLELASDGYLKTKFEQNTLTSFWLDVNSIYPALSEKAVKYLLPLPTFYFCEVGFSLLVGMKTKKQNRLTDMEPQLHLKMTNIDPNISTLTSSQHKQFHPSHQSFLYMGSDFIFFTQFKLGIFYFTFDYK